MHIMERKIQRAHGIYKMPLVRTVTTTWRRSFTFFLLMSTILHHYSVVTIKQSCTYNEPHTAANCSHMGLDYVPWRLHKIINSLDISSNHLNVLDNRSFINYPFISQLYLRNNSMSSMRLNALQKLQYLGLLDISNNKFSHIPTDAINVVAASLTTLILAGNKLSYIPEGSFSELHTLQHLDLSGNSIYLVDEGGFSGLTSLNVFKLRHNAIKYLPPGSFDDFPESMSQVQLYDNRWVCDCRLRWMWKWLNNTDPFVWESRGYDIRCDEPAIVQDHSLDSLSLDKLACAVKMKTSGSTKELSKGSNTTLVCKYTTVPKVEAVWMKNTDEVNVAKYSKKYETSFNEVTGSFNKITYVSELRINDFKYSDIARYKCVIENIRGSDSTEYKLTLKGVDFDSVVVRSPVGQKADESGGIDTRSIVIAVAVVAGIVLIVVIAVLIFCSVNRMQRKKQAKRDAIVEHVKEHFIKNSEVMGGGDTSTLDSSGKTKPFLMPRGMEDCTDGGINGHPHHIKGQDDNHSCSNHTNDSTYKPPLDLEETEPMLIMGGGQSPGSPINNGNTYVSFGSEFTDPGEFPPHVPVYAHHTPNLGNSRYEMNGVGGPNMGSGSHEGSATPLLDRYTPVFVDEPDEPMEDYASYPVYDSLTNSLKHPRLTPPATPNNGNGIYGNPIYNGNAMGDGGIYSNPIYNSGNGIGDGGIYGTSPMHHGSYNNRNGGGGTLDRSMGSTNSFHNAPSLSGGSMPRTPGSVRSVAAVPPYNPSSSRAGNGSPPIIENHYQPPPLTHRPNPQYRDYRDMRYPPAVGSITPASTVTPPANRSVANAKNIGYSPVPSSGPRKPPRIYQPSTGSSISSRDCIELTTPLSSTSAHNSSSDYITSSEAQQYSQNYGITPGTPV